MKLPSLQVIINKSGTTLKRFPLAILSAALAAFVAIYIADVSYDQRNSLDHLYSLIMVSILGISLFTVISLSAEKMGRNILRLSIARGFGLLLLAVYYMLLPEELNNAPASFVFRYILYFLVAHLLVAVGPYWSNGQMSAFWQYNKTLFLRFLTAVLFSAVLYIGLVVALLAIDVLLGIDIDEERYLQLFFFIGGIFNTWFFLAGIPDSIEAFETISDYPKGLKVFTQNILLPLVIIYMIILYLYMGKIIIEWSWPEGWVAYLVLSFSIAGIFALLLLHPIQERVENKWIKQFSRIYFWVLIPLVVLLLLAIWVRIDEYGITVNRYFVLILSLWLGGIVAYFVMSKAKNIKVIPASLCTIAFLISFGPWGAFSVSETSQVNRLQGYLTKNNLLQNGVIQKNDDENEVSLDDRYEISSIVRYLNDTHGLAELQPWFEQDLNNLTKSVNADSTRMLSNYEKPEFVVRNLMGVDYVHYRGSDNTDTEFRQFTAEGKDMLDVKNFDLFIEYRNYNNTEPVSFREGQFSIVAGQKRGALALSVVDLRNQNDTLFVDLNPLAESLLTEYSNDNSYGIASENMMVESKNSSMEARFYIYRINFRVDSDSTELTNVEGRLLLKLKDDEN